MSDLVKKYRAEASEARYRQAIPRPRTVNQLPTVENHEAEAQRLQAEANYADAQAMSAPYEARQHELRRKASDLWNEASWHRAQARAIREEEAIVTQAKEEGRSPREALHEHRVRNAHDHARTLEEKESTRKELLEIERKKRVANLDLSWVKPTQPTPDDAA